MNYILDEEIATLPFAVLLLFLHFSFYREKNRTNRLFRRIAVLNILIICGDILTGIGINHYDRIPFRLNAAANGLYYFICALGVYETTVYAETLIRTVQPEQKHWILNDIWLILYGLSLLGNVFCGYYFYFDTEGYHHGTLFLAGPAIIIVMLILFGLRIARRRIILNKRNAATIYCALGLLIFGLFHQGLLAPEVLGCGLVSTLLTMALLFTQETPEYTKLIELKNRENEKLERECEEQACLALEAQNGIILGLTDLLAGRDPQTAGHVRRTGHVVKILTEEMLKDPENAGNTILLENTAKASPLHDLGDLTAGEKGQPGQGYSGASLLKKVLKNCPDRMLADTAVNIADCHREYYDGSGEKGRKGNDIPREARIVTVAELLDDMVQDMEDTAERDAVDAAFEKTEHCFGTLLDPDLEKYFARCREDLMQYYREQTV